jgi:quinol monooxygenase YgiN
MVPAPVDRVEDTPPSRWYTPIRELTPDAWDEERAMSTTNLRFLVRLEMKPEYAEQVAAMLSEASPRTRAEPGCVRFEASQSRANPVVFVLYEEWATHEDLERHNALPEHQERMARYPAILAGPPEVTPLVPLEAK